MQGVKVHGSDGTVRPMSQQTVYGYMKFLKTYVNDAIVHGLLRDSPCKGLKLKRGESEPGRWLTEAELKRIEDYQTESAGIARVRDLFLTQCYTGLSYADMSDFSPEKLETVDDVLVLTGRRMKTGEQYVVVVLERMLLLNRGYSMEIVARVLGHSDIKTTQKAYTKILEKTVVDAFKKIDLKK